MKIHLSVPTMGTACGIAQYTSELAHALDQLGLAVEMQVGFQHAALLHAQYEYGFYLPECWQQVRNGYPIVATLHTFIDDPALNTRVLKAVDRLIVHDEMINRMLGVQQKTVVIPMGIGDPIEISDGDIQSIRHELGLRNRRPILGSLGFIRPQKGYRELLIAAKILRRAYPELAVLLVAPTHQDRGWAADRLQEFVEYLGMADCTVVVSRWRAEQEMLRILCAADLLILNYVANAIGGGFSAAAKSCLRVRRPLIVTDSLAFADLPSNCVHRILTPQPVPLMEGIRRVWEDPMYQRQLLNAAEHVMVERRWDRMARKHLTLYEELECARS